jgi:cell division protein FtsW
MKYDWQLIVAVVLLCAFGLAFLASSLNTSPQNYWSDLIKQFVVGIGFGGGCAFFLARTDYHIITKHRGLLVKVTLGLLGFVWFFALLAFFANDKQAMIDRFSWLPFKPYIANGAVRWIDLPFGLPNLQPSEIAKITVLIYFAGYMGQKSREDFTWENLKKPLWLLGALSFLIVLQPDLGTIAMIFIIAISSLVVAKVHKNIILSIIGIAFLFGVLFIVSTPYRLKRLNLDSQQVRNIQYAVQSGGLFGKGYGNSEWKQADQIYEPSTDSIIAIIAEEIGFVGTIIFLSLYVWLFFRGMKIAQEAVDLEGKMIATGIVVWVSVQVFLNVCGMTGLIPMKGLPLPFVSRGGTAIAINLIAVGILINISSQKKSQVLARRI